MRLIILCFIYFFATGNGEGYHKTVGIPKAYQLMRLEGFFLPRIVGGNVVTSASAYPYQAGIVVSLTAGLTSICGGALVSNTRVLTAAHCWWDGQNQARSFTIVLGSLTIFTGGTRIITSDVTVYSKWNTNEILYDIAMVRISAVTYSVNIQPVSLPAPSDVSQNFGGFVATATGYGKIRDGQNNFPSSTLLHFVKLNVITNEVCQKRFDIKLHESHLCTNGAGGVGTCDGDSGGPLVVTWNKKPILAGIVSFGLADGCQTGYPSVFTRVSSFLSWIHANL